MRLRVEGLIKYTKNRSNIGHFRKRRLKPCQDYVRTRVKLKLKPRADCDFAVDRIDAERLKISLSGIEKTLLADIVITAFNFHASPADWLSTHGVALEEFGRIAVTKTRPINTWLPTVESAAKTVPSAARSIGQP